MASARLFHGLNGDGRLWAVWHLQRVVFGGATSLLGHRDGRAVVVAGGISGNIDAATRPGLVAFSGGYFGDQCAGCGHHHGVVVGLESLLLPHRFDGVSLISLYLYGFMIGLILTVIAAMLRFPRYLAAPTKYADEGAPPPIDSALEDLFFEKIPLRLGRDLVHLKMQDHYLEVVTDAGQCLVLMRMSDAVAALPEQLGGQVHRSHWIAWGHVDKAINRAGRKFLLLKNGIEVPVSRRFQKVVRARFG